MIYALGFIGCIILCLGLHQTLYIQKDMDVQQAFFTIIVCVWGLSILMFVLIVHEVSKYL